MRAQRKSTIGPKGIAQIIQINNGVRVSFTNDIEANTNPGEVFDIVGDDVWEEGRPFGMFRVTLNSRKDKIVGVGPMDGTYVMSFLEFGKKDATGTPQPWVMKGGQRTGKNGNTWYQEPSLKCTPVLVIHSSSMPQYDGLKVYGLLPYIFERDDDGTAYYTGGNWDMEILEFFLTSAGFDFANDEIQYSGNILPELQTLLKSRDKLLQAEIKNGYVNAKSFGPYIQP